MGLGERLIALLEKSLVLPICQITPLGSFQVRENVTRGKAEARSPCMLLSQSKTGSSTPGNEVSSREWDLARAHGSCSSGRAQHRGNGEWHVGKP